MTRWTVAASIAGLLALGTAGCGIPLDESPQAITQTTLRPTDTTPTTAAASDAAEVSVYFLRGDRLERRGYPVEGEPTLVQALGFVLAAPAGDATSELGTAVPPGTTLLGVEVTDGVATIDLSSEIDDVSGPTQKQAFAQIVFTALSFGDVQQVRFLVDGEVIDAPTDDGNLDLVSADNYDRPLNPR